MIERADKAIKPWYKKWWGILLVIFFFPILVPYLVWAKTSWNKTIKVVITVVCAFVLISGFSGQEQAKADAAKLVEQAEGYLTEGKISDAVVALNESKALDSSSENTALALLVKLEQFQSEDLMKSTFLAMTDEEFEQLQKGELTKTYIEHARLNTLFLAKLKENYINRAVYQAEEEVRLAAEAAQTRKKLIEEQFSAWDGSHRNLTKLIKESMNDPDSYEHVETLYADKGDYIIVQTTFRGKNAFGGLVKNAVTAKITIDGQILEIIEE